MSIGKRVAISILTAALISIIAWPNVISAQDISSAAPNDTITSLLTVQERLDAIEARKGESEAFLSELDAQLTDLTRQLNTLQDQYSEKRAELDLVSQQLTDAEKVASAQRENMALRIQYMYENSTGNGFLDAVFSSDDFQDILTRASNIKELSEFDRKMLDEYVLVCEEIESKRNEVEKEQEEISRLEDQSVEKRLEIQTIYEETLTDIREMASSIHEGHEEEARLLASIQEQEEQLAALFVPAAQQVAAADYNAAQYVQQAAQVTAAEPQAVQNPETEESVEQSSADAAAVPDTADTAEQTETAAQTNAAAEAETAVQTDAATETDIAAAASSSWDGPKLTRAGGVNQGPTGKETYYNLNMSGVVSIMRNMGNTDEYWVRDDGVKMLGDYVMVAADLEEHPRGSVVESSLGQAIVVDTGCLEKDQLDVAVAW